MRQIVLSNPGEFVKRDVSVPTFSPGEGLVRIRKVGVCGSDFHAFTGSHPIYTYPRVLGHELAGEVVEVGANDFDIRIGDRCAIEPYISCGQCKPCQAGRTNCCEKLRVIGIHVDGGMQEFLPVPLSLLHKSEKLSLEELALVETLGIGAHAVSRSKIGQGQSALVVGAGPIGLAVAEFARAAGADVCIVEKSQWRRDFATRLGMKAVAESGGLLSDVVFDATGSAASMSQSLSYVAPGGSLVFVGLTKEPVTLNDSLLHTREMTIYSSRNSCGQFRRIIRMLEESQIKTVPWITDRMALAQVPSEFKDLPRRPTLIKAIVDVEEARS
ncbi:MAG TPA: zinc-binding alcohol dehydrogenase family protein [Terriglobales bacterium]|jgi:2-desacetyl-2-hydroxyethyl bacteriochlorophyllide A dehydrogenase|nr:zinc-binding alcohol dehydrogenase family protein [Terriglobales bacterium]